VKEHRKPRKKKPIRPPGASILPRKRPALASKMDTREISPGRQQLYKRLEVMTSCDLSDRKPLCGLEAGKARGGGTITKGVSSLLRKSLMGKRSHDWAG